MRDLRGKNAVVTGAASGIGQGLAIALAREGMNVALLDIEAARLTETKAAVEAYGVKVHCVALDVSDRPAVYAAADEIRRAMGGVGVLCSNAGVGFRGSILEMADENFDWLFAVNVGGAFNVVKAFVPAMKGQAGGAHVLVTVSASGLLETPAHQNGVYGATKMALLGITRTLREELRPQGIGVTALCPGMVATDSRRSGRQRPARFGGPFDRADTKRAEAPMLTTEEVGRIAVRAIEEDAFLVPTHPVDTLARYSERDRMIRESMQHWAGILPGLGISATLPSLP
jgi:NAD(P)-dependent dehydrogenase (short-subunit alcohol dehydrogenase family)